MGEHDQRRSFGIGGAGNIRTHAEAMVPDLPVVPIDGQPQRRRSSVWSIGSSPNSGGERRPSKVSETIKNMFGGSASKSSPEPTE
ncbi:hypothetical protein F5Y15DRAFT_366807 [Xylariaceae sp. FL0016]|nr:hypothetical protein F5Y15DRAFT_366807 [Xylariaceae sp. FL0016]